MSTSEAANLCSNFWIQAFDVHLCLDPFWHPSLSRSQSACSFLFEKAAYSSTYRGDDPLPELSHFTVKTLGKELLANHFWRHFYDQTLAGENGSVRQAWGRHLPFVFLPKFELGYMGRQVDLVVKVEARIFVWPYAWSSNIEISFLGPVTRGLVEEIAEEVRSDSPFRLGKEPQTLANIFGILTERFKEAVYVQGIVENLEVPKNLVVALFWENVTQAHAATHEGWDSNWARGRVLPLASERLLGNKALHTRLKDPDFAVSLFDRGTLISLSNRTQSRRIIECAATNMRLFLMTAHVLLSLFTSAKPGVSAHLDKLVISAKALLNGLPQGYRNPICKRFLTNHRLASKLGLSREREEESSGEKGDPGE